MTANLADVVVEAAPLREVEATLRELAPALARLHDHILAQREAITAADLSRVVTLTAEHEAVSARVAQLEDRRGALQGVLEGALGVRGLRQVIAAGAPDETDRQRLETLLDEVRDGVLRLQDSNRKNAALLDSAIDVTARARGFLRRLSGVEAGYTRPKGHQLRGVAGEGRALNYSPLGLRPSPGASPEAP